MLLKAKRGKDSVTCEIHGTRHKSANKALLFMLLASLSLMIWHVWVYGPTDTVTNRDRSFLLLLGREIWDLVFDQRGIVAELWSILPYFVVGILLAGYIRTYKIAVKLQATLKRYGFLSVFLASLVGILTPLCACGTITTAVSLLFAGMTLAPVVSLLVTSPLLSPSTYLLTLNDLGPEWTVIRTVAAFSMGIFAGVITHLVTNKGFQTREIFIEGAVPRGDLHDEAYPNERLRCNCKEKLGHRVAARTKNMFVIFLAKSSEMLWLVGKYVLVGVAVGAVVERYMPSKWIYELFGRQDDTFSIIWITLGSVPVFLHQISASSILYHIKSSLNGTLDGGAGLAFLIGGPVTAIPTMVMLWTIFRKRVFFLYMFVCIAGTILIAYTFQYLVFVPHTDVGSPLLTNVSSVSGGSSSVIKKMDKNVRIVMDPGGKSIIAIYNNDLEGHGGIVFDSCGARFMNASINKYDNRQYIKNIAAWLEQNNNSSVKKAILIYDTLYRSGTADEMFSQDVRALLNKQGFTVKITDGHETPVVLEQLLEKYGQLWIFFGESGSGRYFSAAEIEAISRFNSDGKSMLIVDGKNRYGTNYQSAANQISSRYGVTFSGLVENKEELPATTASYFLNRMSKVLGRILKFVHKA